MRGILLIFGLVTFMGVNGQTTIFSDNFNRTTASFGVNDLDNDWLVDIETAGEAGRAWQISPEATCEVGDLRFSDDGGCDYSAGTNANTEHVVYHEVDASGFINVDISFDWTTESLNGQHDDVADFVVSTDADNWTSIDGPYYSNGFVDNGAVANQAIGGAYDNTTFYIGFRIVCNDSDVGNFGGLGDDPLDNLLRFVVDNVVVQGEAIVAGNNWYMTDEADDPGDYTSWVAEGNVGIFGQPIPAPDANIFTSGGNLFHLSIGNFVGDNLTGETAGDFSLGQDWTVDSVYLYTGSTFDNVSHDVVINDMLSIEPGATYFHNSVDQGGGIKTTEFPFDKLLNNNLEGTVALTSSGPGFYNTWDLQSDYDWSASGTIVNNGNWVISGGNTLEVFSLQSTNVNGQTQIDEINTYLRIVNNVDLAAGTSNHFFVNSDINNSGFQLADGLVFSGEFNIDSDEDFNSVGASIVLADNAILNWKDRAGLNHTGAFTISEQNGDGGASILVTGGLSLLAGDDFSFLAPIAGTPPTVNVVTGSKLTLCEGSLDDVVVRENASLVVTAPPAGTGTLTHQDLTVEAKGVFQCEDGSSLIQGGGTKITVEGGATPFSQGGDFIDLNSTTGSSYPAAPQVSISNNIGWTSNTQYTYWSSPITNQAISIPSAIAIFSYTDNSDNAGSGWVTASGNFASGRGYAVRQAGGGVVTQEGVTLTGDIDAADGSPIIGDTDNDQDNWSLVGNPYPSSIHAQTFIDGNSPHMNGALYIWDQSNFSNVFSFVSDDYITINNLGVTGNYGTGGYSNTTDLYLAPFQAWFVNGADGQADGNVTFTNAMRDTSLAGGTHEHSFKSNTVQKLWLRFSEFDEEVPAKTECLIGFVDGATFGWDSQFDAVGNNSGMSIGSIVEEVDSNGVARNKRNAVIQGLPPLQPEMIVDIELEVPHTGAFQLSVEDLENIDNQEIWIRDELLDVSHLLSQQPYIFQVNEAGLYDLQLMFHEPGTIGIEEEMVEAVALDLQRKSGKWESNLDGEVVITTMAGQLLNQFDVKAKQPFAIEEDKGFFHFKSNDGQFKRWMLK